jgi:hypothetical protein
VRFADEIERLRNLGIGGDGHIGLQKPFLRAGPQRLKVVTSPKGLSDFRQLDYVSPAVASGGGHLSAQTLKCVSRTSRPGIANDERRVDPKQRVMNLVETISSSPPADTSTRFCGRTLLVGMVR